MSSFNNILKTGASFYFNAFGRLEDGGQHVNVRVHLQEYQISSLRKVLIMGDKSRRARRGKSKHGGRRQKTEEATNEMSDREKIKCKVC